MKTLKTISLLLGTLALVFALNLSTNASNFSLEEEAYINDIPFNTGDIAAECQYELAVAVEYSFMEEAYIEDIPFDTECVTANCKHEKAIGVIFNLEEEDYVDDIPFNTHNLMSKNRCSQVASRN